GDLETRLAQQGVGLGSSAYDRALEGFNASRAQASDNLTGAMYDRALQAMLTERNQPLNEITALLSGSQVSQPNFVPTQGERVPTVDMASLINDNYQSRLAAWQQKQAQQGGILGGLFGLGGTLG